MQPDESPPELQLVPGAVAIVDFVRLLNLLLEECGRPQKYLRASIVDVMSKILRHASEHEMWCFRA